MPLSWYSNDMNIAIIPARGGSKRLPKKNLKRLNGKPLIVYTIVSALKCKYLDEIIVSSDDKKILEISKKKVQKLSKDQNIFQLINQKVLMH